MHTPRDVLTPDALAMLQTVVDAGSFAAAARQLDLVPSALSYRVRQIEDALDVLLFDRSARQARLTEAGAELIDHVFSTHLEREHRILTRLSAKERDQLANGLAALERALAAENAPVNRAHHS